MSGGKKNVFWGIALLLLAAALLASRMGYLDGIGFWPILLSAVCAAFLVKGIIRGKFGMILFSIACLIIINDELLHLEAITPWPVLGAALLGTIGLNMLFPKFGNRWQKHFSGYWPSGIVCGDNRNGGYYTYENIFGSTVKYVSGDVEHVSVENVFGSIVIYFVDAQPSAGTVNINVDSVFGSVVLYVPSSWGVRVNMQKVFASAGDKGKCSPDGIHELYVNGEVVFGSVWVVYVQK